MPTRDDGPSSKLEINWISLHHLGSESIKHFKFKSSQTTRYIWAYRWYIKEARTFAGWPWGKMLNLEVTLFSRWETDDGAHCKWFSDPVSHHTHTHTHTTLQQPLPHAFRFVFDRALNKMRCVCLSVHKQPCVWWFGECHCTRWLSISAVIPVISSQQSQGGPARIPLDDYVCLPYVLLQLLNWFCWLRDKHSNTLFQSLFILFFLRDLW